MRELVCSFGGVPFAVRFVSNEQITRLAGEPVDGCVVHEKRSIFINRGLREGLLRDTLIHEALHAACPYLAEDTVGTVATEVGELLRRTGF